MNFHQLCKQKPFLQPLARIISDPIFALLIVITLMNSEPSLKIVSFTLYFIQVVVSPYNVFYDNIINSFEAAGKFGIGLISFASALYFFAIIIELQDDKIYLGHET